MRKILFACAAVASFWTVGASAQETVRPRWNYEGSAVCPDGFDYVRGLCRDRGGYYRLQADDGGPGGAGIRPHWNRLGSAVCPEGYDYYARVGRCLPQR
jgi:hypothetical protein